MEVDFQASRHNSFDNGLPIAIISLDDLQLDPKGRRKSSVSYRLRAAVPTEATVVEQPETDPDPQPQPEPTPEVTQTWCFIRLVDRVINGMDEVITKNKKILKITVSIILLLLYLSYVGYSLSFRFGDEGSWRLLVCTIIGLLYLTWKLITASALYETLKKSLGSKNPENITKARKIIKWALYFVVVALIAVYIGLMVVRSSPRNLVSLGGIFVFIFILFLMSKDKANIKWHTVFWGLSLQFAFALVILRTEWGIGAIRWTTDRFLEFIAFSDNGSQFLFSEKYKEFDIIFKAVPSVIVFCAAIAVLSYLGVLALIITNLGGFLGFCLQTNAVESINAATNIFMGGIESLMVINEYIDSLSTSQIFCVYTNGVSSIAGSALVVFASFGVPVEYLLTASVMSAPAALVASKMAYPSERSKDDKKKYVVGTQGTLIDALSTGGMQGLQLMVNVLINLLVYISLFAFLNATLTWFGNRAGVEELTLEKVFSYLLWPLAFIMGIDAVDCLKVAEMLGVRLIATLALSYIQMGTYFSNKEQYNDYTALYNDTEFLPNGDILLPNWNATLAKGILTDRSELIATYAMCGFASIPSMAIGLGAFAALAPNRLAELSKMVVRGLIAGTLASYLTACVAGLIFA